MDSKDIKKYELMDIKTGNTMPVWFWPDFMKEKGTFTISERNPVRLWRMFTKR